MNLHAKLQQRAAEGRPIRIGLIGAGKFGSMYLAQIPRTPGVHLVGIADLSPDAARANLARVGWEAAAHAGRARSTRRCKTGTTHVGDDWRALVRHPAIDVIVECTGHPIAAVDHCLEAFAQRQARRQRHGRGRRLLRPAAGAQGGRGRRRLLAGLRRPAGADLRPGRLGAHLRLPGRRGRPRPQVAAALLRVDARDGVGQLRPDARAGGARRPEPEDVQQLPRRLQAVDRIDRGVQRHRPGGAEQRPALPAGQRRGHPLRHAAEERRRRARAQGHGRGDLVARGRRPQDPLRHPHGRVGHGRGRDRVHQELLRGIQRPHRPERALLHALQALAPDRAGGRRVGGQRGAARRAHRRGHRLERRRGGHRQARPGARRDARRRRRLHRVGQAAAGRHVGARWAACRSAWRTTSRWCGR